MLSQIKKSLSKALSHDPLSDYKVGTNRFRGGKSGLLHFEDAVETSSGRNVSIISINIKEVAARCTTESETHYFIETFRNGVGLLTRLRHPSILHVVRPLVEDQKRLRLVTERVSSLLPLELNNGSLSQQEKLLGLRQCAKAIQFIHERAGYLLLDFSPSAVCLVDGECKLADLSHAVLGSSASNLRVPYPFGGISAPLLDYCATEVVDALKKRDDCGPVDLFIPKNTGSQTVQVPDSDIFSFVLVVCEVLSGQKVFNCGGNASLHAAQLRDADSAVAKWFSHRALASPRPSFASLLNEQIFASPEMLLLVALEEYDTLDDPARFRVLQGVYECLGRSAFTESIVLRRIVPVMRRDGAQMERLRYTLPILLQCCECLSEQSFHAHLRDYFTLFLQSVSGATAFERCSALAEITLEKFPPLARHFSSDADRNAIVVPFLERCLAAQGGDGVLGVVGVVGVGGGGGGGSVNVSRLAVERLAQLAAEALSSAGGSPLRLSDGTAGRLVDAAFADPKHSAPVFVCLDRVLQGAPLRVREMAEERLARCAAAPGLCGGDAGDTLSHALALLERLGDGFAREHRAMCTIPLLAPLLLSDIQVVASFSRRLIEKIVVEVTVLGGARQQQQQQKSFAAVVPPPIRAKEADLSFFQQNTDPFASLF